MVFLYHSLMGNTTGTGTIAELLYDLRAARSRIIISLASGDPVVEYEIRNRRVRRTDPLIALKEIDELIARYQQATEEPKGRARNYIRLTRD